MPGSECDPSARCPGASRRTGNGNRSAWSYHRKRSNHAVCLRWPWRRQSYGCLVYLSQGRRPVLRHGGNEDGREMGALLAGARLQVTEWDTTEEEPSRALRIELAILLSAWLLTFALATVTLIAPSQAEAHPGGLSSDGCHNDRKNGGRHCHRTPAAQTSSSSTRSGSGGVYYPNCAAARAAGAAPIRRGEPGYASHLDRDGDGIACERR